MLASLGVASVDDLFSDIPAALRASGIDLPGPEPELQLAARLQALAADRTDLVSFLGAGVYRHWTPPAGSRPAAAPRRVVRPTRRTSRKSARGTLQSIYEYESLIAELVRLDVVSASHYDGAAATAEAALMSCRQTRRERVLVSHAVHPHVGTDRGRTSAAGSSSRRSPSSRRAMPPARPISRLSRRSSRTPSARSPA